MDVHNIATGQAFCGYEVSKAIARGDLEKPALFKCEDCGKRASEYDHRDYNKPLDVVPVCRSCNHWRGPAIRRVWKRGELLNIFTRCRTIFSWHFPQIIAELGPEAAYLVPMVRDMKHKRVAKERG